MEDCGVKRPARSSCSTNRFRAAYVFSVTSSLALVFSVTGLVLDSPAYAQESPLRRSIDTTTAYASAAKSNSAASPAAASPSAAVPTAAGTPETTASEGTLPQKIVSLPAISGKSANSGKPTRAKQSDIVVADEEPSLSLRDALFEELAQDAERFQRQYGIVKRVVRLVTPTIVHIDAYSGTQSDEAGSGVIIKLNDEFYVLTNRHVVDTPKLVGIKIKTDEGELLEPVKKWEDPATDVAVIKVASKELLPTRVGNSDEVEIGDFVLAVGSPFGLSHSVSYGIISAKGRWDLAIGEAKEDAVRWQDFLQTDAAINPGNSGGPLLNLKGEVVGINTAIASNSGGNEGIGFSIPINLAINVAKQLVQSGAVSTAYLGVRLDHDFDEKLNQNRLLARQLGLSRARGAFVKSVTEGSPADQARLQAGDIVVEFNGVRVEDDDHLINLVSLTPLNEVVSLNIVRARREYYVHVRVGRRRDFEPGG